MKEEIILPKLTQILSNGPSIHLFLGLSGMIWATGYDLGATRTGYMANRVAENPP
jgi:hypothetical protein